MNIYIIFLGTILKDIGAIEFCSDVTLEPPTIFILFISPSFR